MGERIARYARLIVTCGVIFAIGVPLAVVADSSSSPPIVSASYIERSAGQVRLGDDDDKITICHATGSATNPFETITVDRSAFEENPNLQAHLDHEDDLIFEGEEDCPDTEQTPTPTRTPTRTPTGTAATPTGTPEEDGDDDDDDNAFFDDEDDDNDNEGDDDDEEEDEDVAPPPTATPDPLAPIISAPAVQPSPRPPPPRPPPPPPPPPTRTPAPAPAQAPVQLPR
jgi:hypothetical protein